MISNIDVNNFPPQHRKNLKALIFDMETAHQNHQLMYASMIRAHTVKTISSKMIDDKSFAVVEAYRTMIDTINAYTQYIKKNKLESYYG